MQGLEQGMAVGQVRSWVQQILGASLVQACPGLVAGESWGERMRGAKSTFRPLLWKKERGAARLRDGEPQME